MTAAQMRFLDRFVGVPACLVLAALRFMLSKPAKTIQAPRRILFIKLAEQGATVLAFDAIRKAAQQVGPDNLYFLTFEENRQVLDALGLVPNENVFTVPGSHLGAFFAGIARSLAGIHKANIDTTVDLEFFSRASAIISFLSGASGRIGFDAFAPGAYRGSLHTHRVLWNPYIHVAQNFLNLVDVIGTDPKQLPSLPALPQVLSDLPRFHPSLADQERIRCLLGGHSGKHLILLNPNAGDLVPQRRWPADRYVELARRLLERYSNAVVLFTGTAGESHATEALAARVASTRCVSLAGRTTFGELLALYTVSQVLVTNDSGPAHFASLTPISVVALFGPETPAVFGPITPRHQVLWAGIACSPCVSALGGRATRCNNNRCMQAIAIDQVLALVDSDYQSRRTEEGTQAP